MRTLRVPSINSLSKTSPYQHASDQAVSGVEANKDDASVWHLGDLLFFANGEGTGSVRHVGIYFGNGQMIHSPSTGQAIEVRTLAGTRFEKELCAVRRVVQFKSVDRGGMI